MIGGEEAVLDVGVVELQDADLALPAPHRPVHVVHLQRPLAVAPLLEHDLTVDDEARAGVEAMGAAEAKRDLVEVDHEGRARQRGPQAARAGGVQVVLGDRPARVTGRLRLTDEVGDRAAGHPAGIDAALEVPVQRMVQQSGVIGMVGVARQPMLGQRWESAR